MDYYSEVWKKFIKPKSKYKHLKSNTHKKFDIRKQKKLIVENPIKNNTDKKFYAFIIEHSKKFDFLPCKMWI